MASWISEAGLVVGFFFLGMVVWMLVVVGCRGWNPRVRDGTELIFVDNQASGSYIVKFADPIGGERRDLSF
jgi:hypothetical protein